MVGRSLTVLEKELCFGFDGSAPGSSPRLSSNLPTSPSWEFTAPASWMQMGYFGFHVLLRANTEGSRNTFGEQWQSFCCGKAKDNCYVGNAVRCLIYELLINAERINQY